MSSIDDEWSNFISSNNNNCESDDEEELNEDDTLDNNFKLDESIEAPKPSDIYISTKSKIAYLTKPIDYLRIFWEIPIIPYSMPKNGVLKKQIKLNSPTPEYLAEIQERLKKELYYEENVLVSINNPSGRIKFKDIRKISIGVSKKDIMSYRTKQKQAFYNCFVMILRIKMDNEFKEFHIKVFNTGKLEIPGVQSEAMFETVLQHIIQTIQPYTTDVLTYQKTCDTVLINSNFNCGFFINRDVLYNIIKFKYNLQAIYEPCSYPGIQCKFYYNYDLPVQNGILVGDKSNGRYVEVSFMIFRTGSVLIVGMCDEDVLHEIYHFLKSMLVTEFRHIAIGLNNGVNKDKKKKIRKRLITIDKSVTNNDETTTTIQTFLPSAEKKAPIVKAANNIVFLEEDDE